jgi:hypothetical protein
MARTSLLKRHEAKVTWFIVVGVFIGYPVLLTRLNPAPDEHHAEIVRGVIVETGREQPQIRLQFADGHMENFQFPRNLFPGVLIERYPRVYEATDYELNELRGCRTELKVDRIRYLLIPSNRRIWSLQCERITLPYSRIVNYYQNTLRFGPHYWFFLLGAVALLVACAIRDARDARVREAGSLPGNG